MQVTQTRDTNQNLKMGLAFIKGDPPWILKIELEQAEKKLGDTRENEQCRQLNLKIRWLRLEILKTSKLLVT